MNEHLSTDAPLDTLVHHWPGLLFRQRADLTFAFLSPRAAALTGASVERWRDDAGLIWQALPDEDAAAFRQRLERSASAPEGVTGTFRLRHLQTGRIIHLSEFRRALLDAGGTVSGYEGVWMDRTREVAMERRLSAGAWHATLATLAMGMAHDFNNVMAGVLSMSELFLGQTDAQHPFHDGLALIHKNSRQAAQTVQRVVQLYQGRPGAKTYHDLNEIVADTFVLLRKLALRQVEPALQLAPEKLPVYADAVELRQAIVQLVLSAGQMAEERSRITVTTARADVISLGVTADGFVLSADAIPQLCDPFAASSPVSKATAARLGAVKRFAERHDGALKIAATGASTTLRLELPEATFRETEGVEAPANSRPPCVLLAGRDEPALAAQSRSLREAGLRTVIGGADAATLLASEDYAFAALLVTPGGSAEEWRPMLRFARRRTPPLRVILAMPAAAMDEMAAEFSDETDLLVTDDLNGAAFAEKIRAVL